MDERLKRIIYRWIDLIALSITGVLICFLLQSQIIKLGIKLEKSLYGWNYWIQIAIALMFTAVLWFIIGRLGGASFSGFFTKKTICNPPVWFFGVLSFLFYLFIELYLFKDGEYYRTYVIVKEICITLGIFAFGGGIAYILSFICEYTEGNRLTKAEADLDSNAQDFDEVIKDPKMLIEWIHKEEPIEKPSQDYFDMAVFAWRIAYMLKRTPLKTIGLVGPYGCGKSSILKMVEHYLINPQKLKDDNRAPDSQDFYQSRDIILCWVSGWSFREGTAAQHILKAAIKKLGKHTDCLSITTLPTRYGRAIGDSGNVLARIIGAILCGWQSHIDILKKLDVLMGRIEKRMVIFIEDIDRNISEDIFVTEIASLLDILKELDNVSFVLAINYKYEREDVLTRILEHRDTIPRLAHLDVFKWLRTFRKYCLDKYQEDIDCLSEKKREERIKFNRSSNTDLFAEIDELMTDVIDYIARLLISPRVLKMAMRRTWHVWQKLHGEIDFDDLLVSNVLRTAAPQAFMFVNENAVVLRSLKSEPDSDHGKERIKQNREHLQKEFEATTKDVEWDAEAANKLIGFLFLGWIEERWGRPITPTQGVRIAEPTDYWARLMREELSPREVRDQEIMFALDEWNKDRKRKVFRDMNMRDALISGQEVLDKARQFKELINEETLRDQAKEQFQITLQKEKNKASHENCPAVGKWFLLLPEHVDLDSQKWRDWFYEQIKMALPVSLGYVNYLYHLWVDPKRYRPIELRLEIVEEAKRVYGGNPETLVKAINPNRFSVSTFAKYFSEVGQGGSGFKPEEWKWLGETLLKAGERNAEVIIPEISILLGDSNPGPNTKQGWDYNCKFLEELAHKLFGQKFQQLMELLAKSIDVSMYDTQGKAFIACSQSYARKWLSEQGDGAMDS